MAQGGAGRTRRKRGSGPLINLAARVPVSTHQAANEAADALGVSVSVYVEQLIVKDQQVRAESGTSASAGGSTAA